MRDYELTAVIIEKRIAENRLDGTELTRLMMDYPKLKEELKEMQAMAERYAGIEKQLIKLNKPTVFKDEDLIYAATARCLCGAGMAYPKHAYDYDMPYWDCSAILKGTHDPNVKHEAQLPFAFYSLISEEQKERANGQTTRPIK